MTVQELIDTLSALPPEARALSVKAYRSQDDGEGDEYNVYDDIDFAKQHTDDDGVPIVVVYA